MWGAHSLKEAAIGSSPSVTSLRDEILEMDVRCMRLKESLLALKHCV